MLALILTIASREIVDMDDFQHITGFQLSELEMRKMILELQTENASLKAAIKDMLHAADDLGIYPAATIQPDGTEVKRTPQQEGYNEAVMTLGSALDLIAAKHKIEVDENREDPWCWSKPLANLQNLIEQLKREKLEMLNNNKTDEYVCVDREHGLWKRKDKTL